MHRLVRSLVWDARWSHDPTQKFPERLRKRNPERRDRAKKFETFTIGILSDTQKIDSILSFWPPSSRGVNEEMMEVRVS